jgi:membrane protease YdiL (CAAX protease family)
MAVVFIGFAILMYAGAVRGERFAVRCTIGWVGVPWQQWVRAAMAGCALGVGVTSVTVAFGHSIHVVEPIHNLVLAATLGPIVEEVCLRGVLVPLLARLIGTAAAVLVTSAVFALLHWPASLLKLGSIGATGAAYGWIRVGSGSTAVATAAHATYNLTVIVLGLS